MRFFLLSVLCVFFLSSCGITSRTSRVERVDNNIETEEISDVRIPLTSTLPSVKGEKIESGMASWYGPNFNGRLTANGETFDMNGVSAAHRTLPFNTEVIVVNIDNGKSIRVRINDRGPYAKDRIIDLSKAAAEAVDMIGPGTANVELYLVKGDLKNSRVTDLKVPNYTVQLGSYVERNPASTLSQKIKGSRVESLSLNGKPIYRVYYGSYTDKSKAEKDMKSLQKKGFNGFIKQIEND